MKSAVLRGSGLLNNVIFDRENPANRDDCFGPYVLLKQRFAAYGIALNTSDMAGAAPVEIELHQDIQRGPALTSSYALMLETEFVRPENADPRNWEKYRKVFTWNDQLVDGKKFIKLNPPNPMSVCQADGWGGRSRFCCLISSNKTLPASNVRDLYVERVKTIRWFESHAPEAFDLYGNDWDRPVIGRGLFGKIQRQFWRHFASVISLRPFPSYRGRVEHKRQVLEKTRFSICYENVRDVPGYITEKIFDSFFAGCVPVYWGADNIGNYIPLDCFIDRRLFQDHASLYAFLRSMTEEEYLGYQRRIARYLASDNARQFGSECFADTIVSAIVADLGV